MAPVRCREGLGTAGPGGTRLVFLHNKVELCRVDTGAVVVGILGPGRVGLDREQDT